jgi:hypothetical protein
MKASFLVVASNHEISEIHEISELLINRKDHRKRVVYV